MTLFIKSRDIISIIQDKTRDRLSERGYQFCSVGWFDNKRAFQSNIGPNISDWSFLKKNGTQEKLLPFIRSKSNYEDKTLTIKAKNLAVVVGNDKPEGFLNTITLEDYLKNYGKHTPGVPEDANLSSEPDELVNVRFIAVIVPEDKNGTAEGVWTAYNYQTQDKKDPKNFITASFHLGVGSCSDGPGCEKVYLVKTNEDGSHENTYFRLTNENMETEEQKKAVGSVLGSSSTGIGRNRVQCIQIPRKQKNRRNNLMSNSKCFMESDSYEDACASSRPVYRSLSFTPANVSYGSNAGRHSMVEDLTYERNKDEPVTVTFAYYFTVPDSGDFEIEEIDKIMDILDKSYQDTQSEWLGSLVTGEVDSNFDSESKDIPFKLPGVTDEDYLTFNQKVKHFPKDIKDLQTFPTS